MSITLDCPESSTWWIRAVAGIMPTFTTLVTLAAETSGRVAFAFSFVSFALACTLLELLAPPPFECSRL